MPDLSDAAQALMNRLEAVRVFVAGERSSDAGALGLALNRLEDGVTTAGAALNREARFGRVSTEAYQLLDAVRQEAAEVLKSGGEMLASRNEVVPESEGSAVVPASFEMPGPTSMLVGGVIGFGLAWLALKWMSTRGV